MVAVPAHNGSRVSSGFIEQLLCIFVTSFFFHVSCYISSVFSWLIWREPSFHMFFSSSISFLQSGDALAESNEITVTNPSALFANPDVFNHQPAFSPSVSSLGNADLFSEFESTRYDPSNPAFDIPSLSDFSRPALSLAKSGLSTDDRINSSLFPGNYDDTAVSGLDSTSTSFEMVISKDFNVGPCNEKFFNLCCIALGSQDVIRSNTLSWKAVECADCASQHYIISLNSICSFLELYLSILLKLMCARSCRLLVGEVSCTRYNITSSGSNLSKYFGYHVFPGLVYFRLLSYITLSKHINPQLINPLSGSFSMPLL